MSTLIKRLAVLCALGGLLVASRQAGQWEIPDALTSLPTGIVEYGKEYLSDTAALQEPAPDAADTQGRILAAMEACQDEVVLYNISEEELTGGYSQVLAGHPELFWVVPSYSWTTTTYPGGANKRVLKFSYSGTDAQIAQRRQELEAEVQRILGLLDEGMSDFDKALFLHDYLVKTTQYDGDGAAELDLEPAERAHFDSATAYGCLMDHSAVCSGYASAYQLLLQRAGIPCGRISGQGQGESHEWNYITLGGEDYYVDVTWDDPVTTGEIAYPLSHEYFAITTDELLLTHTIDPDQTAPVCDATEYDYYRHSGRYLDEYTFDAVSQLVEEQRADGAAEMKFGSPQELDRAVRDLFAGQAIFRIPSLRTSGRTVHYSVGSSGLVLRMVF